VSIQANTMHCKEWGITRQPQINYINSKFWFTTPQMLKDRKYTADLNQPNQ
jgi:hypothetical protein